MDYYADSSFLVSCYLADANTRVAKSQLEKIRSALPFTALHSLEMRNAFRLAVFRDFITPAQASMAAADLEEDLDRGRLLKTSVKWPMVFRSALSLCERHSSLTGARSLDILHVATAKVVRLTHFVSFDKRQNKIAIRAGLTVHP